MGTSRSRRVLLLLFVLGLGACGGNGSPSAGTKPASGSATTTTARAAKRARAQSARAPMTDEQARKAIVITSCGANASNNLEIKGTVTTTGSSKAIFSAVINANDPSGKLLYPVNLQLADDVPGQPVSFTSTVQSPFVAGTTCTVARAFVNPAAGDGNASSHDASATTAPPNLPPGATLLKGTATDFCSAIYEGGTRISAAHGPITDVAPILNEWVADLRTYAPPDLRDHVSVLTTGLVEVSKNVQLGVIATNEDIKDAMNKVLALPDSRAIGDYAKANCPR